MSKHEKPWEHRPAQHYFPLLAKGNEIFGDSGTLNIATIRGYLGEDKQLAAEIVERCNRKPDDTLPVKLRAITRQGISVYQIDGYYIRLMVEYPPLNLRRCIKLRRWNESCGLDREEAIEETLEFFNHEAQRMHNWLCGQEVE